MINRLKKVKILKWAWKRLNTAKKDFFLFFLYPAIYRFHAGRSADPNLVLFIERRYDHLQDSLALLYEQVSGNYEFTVHVHCLNQDHVPGRIYRKNCRKMVADLARASYVFLSDANDVVSCVPKRPETVIIQTWHACGAFKRFGLSTGEFLFGESTKEQLRHPGYGNLDIVTVSSPEVVWAYEEAMGLKDKPGIVQPLGVSRTDVFFREDMIGKARERLYTVFPPARGKKVILYAPTYRGWASRAETPDRLDIRAFAEKLGEEYVLLIKHHPLVKKVPPISTDLSETFACDVSLLMSIEDLLMVSDICISDYSSVIFEFALYERPMLFFAYDLEEYFDWRGFYYSYEEMTPGPVCRTNEEMIEWILQADRNFDRKTVTDFREKYMSACDGRATQRILETIFGTVGGSKARSKARTKPACTRTVSAGSRPFAGPALMRKLKKIPVRLIKRVCLHVWFPMEYRRLIRKEKPSGSVVVMFEEYADHVSANCLAVIKELEQRGGYEIHQVCLGRGQKGAASFFRSCPDAIRMIARAKVIFMEDSSELISCLPLEHNTKVIQLWHACGAFKRFGYSLEGKKYGADRKELELFPRHENFTFVTVSSPQVAWAYAEAFHMEETAERIVPTGIARTDYFFIRENAERAREKLEKIIPETGRKYVLFAPTFRGDAATARSPEMPDFSGLKAAMGPEWFFLVKQHPFVKHRPQIPPEQRDYVRDVTDEMDINDLMMLSDVCITDYSSIVFEFALLDRPILFFVPDLPDYNDWRGFYYPFEEMTPGPVCRTSKEMIEWIRDLDGHFDRTRMAVFREKFMSACDGHSAERIVDLAIGTDAGEKI